MEGIWLWSYVALWAVTLVQSLFLLALMRQIGLLHLRVGATGARMGNSGPEIGVLAPELTARDLNSSELVTMGVGRGKSTMLVFISPGCTSCESLMPGFLALRRHEKDTEFILVSDVADQRLNLEFIQRHRLDKATFVADPEIAERYRIGGSPYAVLIDPEGVTLAKGLANHLEHLESLFNARDLGLPSHESRMITLASK